VNLLLKKHYIVLLMMSCALRASEYGKIEMTNSHKDLEKAVFVIAPDPLHVESHRQSEEILPVAAVVDGSRNGNCVQMPDIPSLDDCKSACISCSNSKYGRGAIALTVLGAIGLTFGLVYKPHTYKVYNRESSAIDIHYRPGCTKTVNKNSVQVDCEKTIYPNNHAVIYSAGDLTKLCATYSSGSLYHQECTTDKGLQTDYYWYVHGDLTFTRGKDKSSQPKNSSASNVDLVEHVEMPIYLRGSIENIH